ncbi:Clp protease N-terminal domain-containing protein [Nocardia sp. NBC_01503]|uniref:Clp protease N-terminal domain-containing protein n=1 Tax=Nocardia sp. NBC_01503 TaxID=2975997 RepID=UPI002E7BAE60|nr:Clp protease N-terminal domain-containing protein [Nocardia sp. NBC_01503]WTL35245.1 Clp protease N-terminal domain-containing protein [Nocardia sp. NBC_01503]
MTSFDKYLHAILTRGSEHARVDGSATIEAQHLLLAIAAEADPGTDRILAAAGLTEHGIRAALDREFEHSLAAAGVSVADYALPHPRPAAERPQNMGASLKLALDRTFTTVRRSEVRPEHLLLGILRAEVGTVPRALTLAGIDLPDLRARIERELSEHQV